ncbi:hypothetical protein P3T27_003354 [Kitasatospora sp. MAA19]|nr:hypothetical protein [Kitasatospora sp. MAA19]
MPRRPQRPCRPHPRAAVAWPGQSLRERESSRRGLGRPAAGHPALRLRAQRLHGQHARAVPVVPRPTAFTTSRGAMTRQATTPTEPPRPCPTSGIAAITSGKTVRMTWCRFERWPDPRKDWLWCLPVDLSATARSGIYCRRAGDVPRSGALATGTVTVLTSPARRRPPVARRSGDRRPRPASRSPLPRVTSRPTPLKRSSSASTPTRTSTRRPSSTSSAPPWTDAPSRPPPRATASSSPGPARSAPCAGPGGVHRLLRRRARPPPARRGHRRDRGQPARQGSTPTPWQDRRRRRGSGGPPGPPRRPRPGRRRRRRHSRLLHLVAARQLRVGDSPSNVLSFDGLPPTRGPPRIRPVPAYHHEPPTKSPSPDLVGWLEAELRHRTAW